MKKGIICIFVCMVMVLSAVAPISGNILTKLFDLAAGCCADAMLAIVEPDEADQREPAVGFGEFRKARGAPAFVFFEQGSHEAMVAVSARPKENRRPLAGGAGFGFQIGAQVSELVIVLNTPDAVKAFSQGGNVSLGADLKRGGGSHW